MQPSSLADMDHLNPTSFSSLPVIGKEQFGIPQYGICPIFQEDGTFGSYFYLVDCFAILISVLCPLESITLGPETVSLPGYTS